jgi:hypothetical protein
MVIRGEYTGTREHAVTLGPISQAHGRDWGGSVSAVRETSVYRNLDLASCATTSRRFAVSSARFNQEPSRLIVSRSTACTKFSPKHHRHHGVQD